MQNDQKELLAKLVELSSKYPDRQVVFYVPGESYVDDGVCAVTNFESVELDEILDDRDFNERTERLWTKSEIEYIRDQIMCDENNIYELTKEEKEANDWNTVYYE